MTQKKFSYDYPHPAVTTDIVVFTIKDDALNVLLIKRKLEPFEGRWALPGGFVGIDEDLEDCARRELAEESGVHDPYLEQLYTFGTTGRDPRERVITVGYFALVKSEQVKPEAGSDAQDAQWFPAGGLPDLAFDHTAIIEMAKQRLTAKLGYSTIAFRLLAEEFTLTEVQKLYEQIQGERLDKRNFRKWLTAHCSLVETGEKKKSGAHRPAMLFRLESPDPVSVFG